MKAEDLKIAIRKLIREEVKKVVAEEVNKAMGKVLVEMVREIKETPKRVVNESISTVQKQTNTTQAAIIKTNNPKLNNVLAETARNFTPLQKSGTSMVDLMDGGFEQVGQGESVGIEEPKTNMAFLKQIVSQTPVVQTPSVLDSNNPAVPEALQNVFKKDFRAVMKKIDEQKKFGGGGMNSSVLLG